MLSQAPALRRCLGVREVTGGGVVGKEGFLFLGKLKNVFVLVWARKSTVGRFGVTSSKTAREEITAHPEGLARG